MEVFISEIENRRLLWDKTSPEYNDRRLVDEEWQSVAKTVGISKIAAKKKWRNLRDIFMRELKKIPAAKLDDSQEDAPGYKGKWKFFPYMMFLKDSLTPRARQRKVSEEFPYIADPLLTKRSVSEFSENNTEEESRCAISVNETPPPARPNRKRKFESTDMEDKLETENTKKNATLQEEDGDSLFLRSLKPYFKQFSPKQNVTVRMQFMAIVLQELEKNDDY